MMKVAQEVKYLSVQQIVNGGKYPFTLGQMRSYLIFRNKNGLSKAVRKIGNRIFFKIDLFDEWIESKCEE